MITLEPINTLIRMDFLNKNIECAKRIQDYLGVGDTTVYGLFQYGEPIGIFRDVSELTLPLRRHPGCVIPLHIKDTSPSSVNENYSSQRQKIIDTFKSLIDERERCPVDNVGWIEVLYLYMMQNPEFIARETRFRDIAIEKHKEYQTQLVELYRYKFHPSSILLKDVPRFLRQIKNHPNFHPTNTPVESKKEPIQPNKHSYNLRPRK